MSKFQKAQRKKAKLRLGIEGPSGSGKTYSSILMAQGLAPDGEIAVIDTENNSASLYSHLADYDVAELSPPYTPENYIELINEAAKEYDVLIIDSITHEWTGKGGILDIHDNMPGNSFQNWAKVNPRHNAFMEAMLHAPCHVIATMRSKEQYILQENNQGKQEPKKAGTKEQQRDGVIYEFTTVLTMDVSNQATRNKDRTGLFQHNVWFVPTVNTGAAFREWLEGGAEPPPSPINKEQQDSIIAKLKQLGCGTKDKAMPKINTWLENQGYNTVSASKELTQDQATALMNDLDHEIADMEAAEGEQQEEVENATANE